MKDIIGDINNVGSIFIALVDALLDKKVAGKNIYALTKEGSYINFRVNDFKKVLHGLITKESYKDYMVIFRNLEWIICNEGRFTNAQFINGKTVRVISIDIKKYEQLKTLL